MLESHGSASKTLSTFVDGFLAHLRPDGLLHPTYMLFHGGFNDDEDDEAGTVTRGAPVAKDPAFQTVPKKTTMGQAAARLLQRAARQGAGPDRLQPGRIAA